MDNSGKMGSRELVVFLDCGDTIVDESTQAFDEQGNVLSARPIAGAVEMIWELHRMGYRLALVADGRTASFHNILGGLGIEHLFEARIISQEVGVEKPHPLMFQTAMDAMGLKSADSHRAVMVGNNIKRDILGARRMGLHSVLLTFSPRYSMHPEHEGERPDYTIGMPAQLPGILDAISKRIAHSVGG